VGDGPTRLGRLLADHRPGGEEPHRSGGHPRSGGQDAGDEAEEALTVAGRIGLAGRTGFYAVLAGLVAGIATLGRPSGHQADSQGALQIICSSVVGQVAVAVAALGFVLLGVGRLVGAVHDEDAGRWRRLATGAQGAFYVVLAAVPCEYLAGKHQTGSEQQQTKTAQQVMSLPGGRFIVVLVGLVLLGVCAQQIRGAVQQDFADGLELEKAPAVIRRFAGLAGSVGIVSRTLVFVPVGIFLIVAGIQADPHHADGIDAELLALSGSWWGDAVLGLVAAGLFVFVAYSAIEARYRQVVSAR